METLVGVALKVGVDLAKYGTESLLEASRVQCAQLGSNARDNANRMKEEYGRGTAALIVFANRSDVDLRLACAGDAPGAGKLWKYPLPATLGPGQTASLLHVGSSAGGSATGAVVYHVSGSAYDVLFAWHVAGSASGRNATYTAIREQNYWKKSSMLDGVLKQVPDQRTVSRGRGLQDVFESTASIGQTGSPLLELEFNRLDRHDQQPPVAAAAASSASAASHS